MVRVIAQGVDVEVTVDPLGDGCGFAAVDAGV
jgi:hypothetical protein